MSFKFDQYSTPNYNFTSEVRSLEIFHESQRVIPLQAVISDPFSLNAGFHSIINAGKNLYFFPLHQVPCVTQHPVSKVDGFWYACCNIKDTFLWTDPRLSSFLLIFMICKDGQISMFLWAYVGYEIANHIPLLVFVVIVSRKGHERITLTFFAVFFAPRPPLSVSLSLSTLNGRPG